MKRMRQSAPATCDCGCKEFEIDSQYDKQTVRELHILCRKCGRAHAVNKTTYALYKYLGRQKASVSFKKLFDLS